jgi:hypothetical protein
MVCMRREDLEEYQKSLKNFKEATEKSVQNTLGSLYTPSHPSPTDRGTPPNKRSPSP